MVGSVFLIAHLLRFSVKHPRVVVALAGAITVCALLFIPRIQLRLDGRSLIPSGLPEFAEGDRAASRFELRDLCQGTGTWSDVINGVNFVTWHRGQPAQQGYPAVANMSLSGDTNRAVEAAVRNSIRTGVTYVVAAGNWNSDATNYSPAGVVEAITVGATNQSDARADFSNYGPALDLFAPGVGITSAWIGNDLMIATASGTSMAAPHVAGVVALYLQTHRSASPAEVRSALVGNSTTGVVRNPGQESPNRLLFTNY
jgi:subtilisin family serine protease